jgi:hypothetical protein
MKSGEPSHHPSATRMTAAPIAAPRQAGDIPIHTVLTIAIILACPV